MVGTNGYKITNVTLAKNEEQTIGAIVDKIILNFGADKIIVIVDETADRTAIYKVSGKKPMNFLIEKKENILKRLNYILSRVSIISI